ncbi:hypothetical protein FXR79_07830 [Campylobacter coli]|nr:hypothetical protein [Campylobacter coli]
MQAYYKNMKKFIQEREDFVKEYQEIKEKLESLNNDTKLKKIKDKCFELKTLIEYKNILLNSSQYVKELSIQLEELNNKIYYITRTLLQDLKSHNVKEIYQYTEETNKKNNIEDRYNQDKDFLEKIYVKLDEKYSINSLYNLAKYFAKHWVLLLVLCGIVGAFILMKYFALDIHYTPIITQENALYLIFVTSIIGMAYTSLIFLFFISFIYFIKKIQEKSKRYWTKKEIFSFAVSVNIICLSLVFVAFADTFNIFPKWLLIVISTVFIFEFVIFLCFLVKNREDKITLIFYVILTAFLIFFFYFLFIFLSIDYNSTWQDFLFFTLLFFIYDFISIFVIMRLNFSTINFSFLAGILGLTLLISTSSSSSNIVSILKLGNYDLKSLSISPNASSNYQKNCDFAILKDEIILKNVHILSSRGEKILLACKSKPVLAKKDDLNSAINKISNNTKKLILNLNHTIDIPSICQREKNNKGEIVLANIHILNKNENSIVFRCINSNIDIESNFVNNSIYEN